MDCIRRTVCYLTSMLGELIVSHNAMPVMHSCTVYRKPSNLEYGSGYQQLCMTESQSSWVILTQFLPRPHIYHVQNSQASSRASDNTKTLDLVKKFVGHGSMSWLLNLQYKTIPISNCNLRGSLPNLLVCLPCSNVSNVGEVWDLEQVWHTVREQNIVFATLLEAWEFSILALRVLLSFRMCL